MEAANDERESLQEQTNHRQQIRFADVFHRRHEFPLGNDIHRVDMVNTLESIPMALAQLSQLTG
jgi:hypothetical protein